MTGKTFDEMQRAAQYRVDMMRTRADQFINMTNSRMNGDDSYHGEEYSESPEHGRNVRSDGMQERQADGHSQSRRMDVNAVPVVSQASGERECGDLPEKEKKQDGSLNFIQQFLTSDRIIILAVIAALWGENADSVLMIALIYILL